jgi:hypothetical protein
MVMLLMMMMIDDDGDDDDDMSETTSEDVLGVFGPCSTTDLGDCVSQYL